VSTIVEERERQKRACPKCGYERRVVIFCWDGKECEPPLCGACQALARAQHYERLALKFRTRYEELMFKRRGTQR